MLSCEIGSISWRMKLQETVFLDSLIQFLCSLFDEMCLARFYFRQLCILLLLLVIDIAGVLFDFPFVDLDRFRIAWHTECGRICKKRRNSSVFVYLKHINIFVFFKKKFNISINFSLSLSLNKYNKTNKPHYPISLLVSQRDAFCPLLFSPVLHPASSFHDRFRVHAV